MSKLKVGDRVFVQAVVTDHANDLNGSPRYEVEFTENKASRWFPESDLKQATAPMKADRKDSRSSALERIMEFGPTRLIAAVQQVLGPTLGMVTREELALAVEAAYRDGHGDGVQAERNLCQNDESYNENDDWDASATRKALGGGE